MKAIDWTRIPITTSLVLYKRIKEEVLRLRDSEDNSDSLVGAEQRLELLPALNVSRPPNC